MMKLNKKMEYALMALKYFSLQTAKNTLSAKEVAEATHAPYEVVARVLQSLSSNGWLKAEYGTQGGYQLVKNLNSATVHELMLLIEGSTEITNCLNSEKECDLAKKCTIINPIQSLNQKIQNFYKSMKVSEILHV